jgi:hypothetical protein
MTQAFESDPATLVVSIGRAIAPGGGRGWRGRERRFRQRGLY